MKLDPKQTYVHLAREGSATELPGGEAFWSLPEAQIERYGQGWLVAEFEFTSDWPNWEMHPHADEYVYLLSGSVDLLLEQPGGTQPVPLRGSGAVVVPRGVWHTARVHAPSRMLHVTMGAGTEQRPRKEKPVARQRISSGSTFEAQIGYSRAVVAGNWVFVSGTTGFDYSKMSIPDSLVEQAEQCLKNIEAALREAGASLADVVRVTYVLPDAAQFEQCWPVLRKSFGEVRPAAMMISAGLADPRMKIEIEVTALKQGQE